MIVSQIENFSSMSAVKAKVDIYKNSTLVQTCTCSDVLEKFKIIRDGDTSKFFGFGVSHKINIDFIDLDRVLDVTTDNTVYACLGNGTVFDCPYPKFYLTEVTRDENTNNIAAVGYDKLYFASQHTVDELGLIPPYTLKQVAEACATFLELPLIAIEDASFDTTYEEGANFDGKETLRDVLTAIAEATQTIYYINHEEKLVFKRLDISGQPVLIVNKNNYYKLTSKMGRTINAIWSTTELGDTLHSSLDSEGYPQYVRDNPFWDLHPDRPQLVDNALIAVTGLTFNQFYCDWDGDYRLEIGDKVSFINNENISIPVYLLNDFIEYGGTLNEITQWEFTESSADSAYNATNLGERLNQTYARVDKVNKKVDIVVSDVAGNSSVLSQLQLDVNGINASVTTVQEAVQDIDKTTTERIDSIAKEVSLKVDSDAVEIKIENRVKDGVDKLVTSSKRYTFDDSGMNIGSSSNNLNTKITEDGMKITRSNEEVLVADNTGVKAEDLHATTYLIIGDNSRLEDWGNRTACFWIGG